MVLIVGSAPLNYFEMVHNVGNQEIQDFLSGVTEARSAEVWNKIGKITSILTIFSWCQFFYFCHLITISSKLTINAPTAEFPPLQVRRYLETPQQNLESVQVQNCLVKIYQKPQNVYWKTFKRWIQSDTLASEQYQQTEANNCP